MICGHFAQITNDFCPEEKIHIRERSLSVVNLFLDEMAKEAKNIITTICDEQCNYSDRLLPKHCAVMIAEVSYLFSVKIHTDFQFLYLIFEIVILS